MTDQNENKPDDTSAEMPETETGAGDAPGTETTANDTAAPGQADDTADPQAEIADLKDKLLRALAETENLRRRSQKEREDALKYAASNFARDMLGVGDNLRRAIDSIPDDGDPDGTALAAFIEGVSLTEKELLATLERHGIRKIDPMGQKFDPQFHEAMFEAPVPGAENGTVFQVVETGYLIHDRLLRPAKVGVAKAAPEPTEPGEQVDTKA